MSNSYGDSTQYGIDAAVLFPWNPTVGSSIFTTKPRGITLIIPCIFDPGRKATNVYGGMKAWQIGLLEIVNVNMNYQVPRKYVSDAIAMASTAGSLLVCNKMCGSFFVFV